MQCKPLEGKYKNEWQHDRSVDISKWPPFNVRSFLAYWELIFDYVILIRDNITITENNDMFILQTSFRNAFTDATKIHLTVLHSMELKLFEIGPKRTQEQEQRQLTLAKVVRKVKRLPTLHHSFNGWFYTLRDILHIQLSITLYHFSSILKTQKERNERKLYQRNTWYVTNTNYGI